MACIEKIYSVSALIGDDSCNANCSFCAGKYLRPQAEADNPLYWRNLEAAIKLSARYGGWSLSLTGSGEPTCSPFYVGKALPSTEEVEKMRDWLEGNPNFRVRFLADETAHEESYSAKLTLFPDGSLTNTWCR